MTDPVEQKQITARVAVLSQKGCFARTPTLVAHGPILKIQIQHNGAVFETWARATPSQPEGETGVVLVFMDTPPEQSKVLAGWLDALSTRKR